MSGILKKMKHKKSRLVALGFAFGNGVLIWCGWYVAAAVLCIATGLDLAVLQKINRQKELFSPRSTVRNVDYLIIGDMCSATKFIPVGSNYVQISAPGRSLNASYEILRHTFSILPEQGGKVILAIREGNVDKNCYTLFDVPFFHPVTLERLRLKSMVWQSKFPLFFAPLRSLRFLLGTDRQYHPVPCPREDIRDFCTQRDLQLIYVQG